MSAEGQQVAQIWRDTDFASSWAANDAWADMLTLPRQIAAAVVRETCRPKLVIDVASGPGDFLNAFLTAYPEARGVWTDASEAMLEMATERLAPFAYRTEFHLVDMTDLASAKLPTGADVITSSRASHHLSDETLRAFYREVYGHLAPGGYVINLDHTTAAGPWNERYRNARAALRPPRTGPKNSHHHDRPSPTAATHLDAMQDAGFIEIDIAWKAFVTCMFIARRPS